MQFPGSDLVIDFSSINMDARAYGKIAVPGYF
jgi:hypothetical protein